ncbi:MAG TPA: ABC transporter ATP-binding protein [Lentimicrobium sp.]|nr:ABC transporter ATP-binding protein [Lentimicrobium sp.]
MDTLVVDSVSKWYGKEKLIALNKVSFNINKGEIFGLIGPDGAGKTSLFRVLTTLLLPDEGNAYVAGYDVVKEYKKIRNSIGYMPGKFSLYQDLTVEENLNFFATIFKTTVKENYHLIKDIYIQLEPFKNRRAGKLSGGMKQKLALCCALIHKPTVLFLDEPTTGVDPVSRKEFWQMLKNLKKEGITILVSTPYMDEASMCDRIALMQKAEILAIDTPTAIIDAYPLCLYKFKADNIITLYNDIRLFSDQLYAYPFGESIHVTFKESEFQFVRLIDYLKENHSGLIYESETATIEDCFIQLLKG